MNNYEIKAAIKANLISSRPPGQAWTEDDDLLVNALTMRAEKLMKESGQPSRLQAWSEVKHEVLIAPE
jgi:hypothetical protein